MKLTNGETRCDKHIPSPHGKDHCGKPAPHQVAVEGVPGTCDYCDEHWTLIQSGEHGHKAKKVN